MILPDKVYNVLKWVLITFVPALLVLIESLGVIYGYDTQVVVFCVSVTVVTACTAPFSCSILYLYNIKH